jgi:dTDP-4-dehydrorhamnose 3,5-epimerase
LIPNLEIHDIIKNIDERGFFTELFREDWHTLLKDDKIVQFNLSHSYPNIVRAWHRHNLGQVDYFTCIDGAVKVCAYDDRPHSSTFGEIDEIILSRERLALVKIPGILWHGYKVVSEKPATVLYGVNKLYDYKNPDEERRPWNDEKIIPLSINGKTNDLRVGKSWDWYYSPNK